MPTLNTRQQAPADAPRADEDGPEAPAGGGRILVVNADAATYGLLCEWLGAEGFGVSDERDAQASARGPFTAVIVDVPFARHGGLELLGEVAARHPGTPLLALSATFFSSVQCSGGCAHALGVSGVLPKPLTREALVAALRNLPPAGR